LDAVYEYSGEEETPLLLQARVALHTLICQDCAQRIARFEASRSILQRDFLPNNVPALEDSIMSRIAAEEGETLEALEAEESAVLPGGLSTRGWVIAGIAVLVSLATAFFGFDFNKIAHAAGMSFLLPVGITIGIVLTSYGALFIGSHLKELSERFGL
jgi:hypothetical protein